MSRSRPARVRTYSGYKADERPTQFSCDRVDHDVADVVKQWQEPDADVFEVRTVENRRFVLRRDRATDTWSALEQ